MSHSDILGGWYDAAKTEDSADKYLIRETSMGGGGAKWHFSNGLQLPVVAFSSNQFTLDTFPLPIHSKFIKAIQTRNVKNSDNKKDYLIMCMDFELLILMIQVEARQ